MFITRTCFLDLWPSKTFQHVWHCVVNLKVNYQSLLMRHCCSSKIRTPTSLPSVPFDVTRTWRKRFHLTRLEDVSVTPKALQIGDVQYVCITSSWRLENWSNTSNRHVLITCERRFYLHPKTSPGRDGRKRFHLTRLKTCPSPKKRYKSETSKTFTKRLPDVLKTKAIP